jgi:hypothetical protein
VLDFDEKVNLEGVLCRENANGRTCLLEHSRAKKGAQVVLFDGCIDVIEEDFCDVFPSPSRAVEVVWV